MALTGKKEVDSSKINLPEQFYSHLIEVVDPSQSLDYMAIGSTLFPVQVLPFYLENKIVRMSLLIDQETAHNYDTILTRSTGEICRFYRPNLELDWPEKNDSKEKIEQFYLAHLEKIGYNQTVIDAVNQIISEIEWNPVDDDRIKELEKYRPADIIRSVLSLQNIMENRSITEVSHGFTSGMIEIIKLSNMISNDKMRAKPKQKAKQDKIDKQMGEARTLDDYMAGMAAQGVNIKDIFG